MPSPEFTPGFRISAYDVILLVIGTLSSWLLWSRILWLGFVIAFVVGHFFLFCNVFRFTRRPELIWSALFLILTGATILSGHPSWMTTIFLSLAVTVSVICIELRKPYYHGVCWQRFNPELPTWWKSQSH